MEPRKTVLDQPLLPNYVADIPRKRKIKYELEGMKGITKYKVTLRFNNFVNPMILLLQSVIILFHHMSTTNFEF